MINPPRLEAGFRPNKDDKTSRHQPSSAPAPRSVRHVSDKMEREAPRDILPPLFDRCDADASRVNRTSNTASTYGAVQDPPYTRSAGYAVSLRSSRHGDAPVHTQAGTTDRPQRGVRQTPSSGNSNSQDTNSSTNDTNDTDDVFTPPGSEGGMSGGNGGGSANGKGNAQNTSQESQLLQLSHLAAAQEKMPQGDAAFSRKRTADGAVKHTRQRSSASPVRVSGHSRNTSTLSVASTASSRIGELSAELKARLSYAMVKVNHGWQSHSIDQIESLASQAGSPTSSTSTVHGRYGTSASPRIPASSSSQRPDQHASPASTAHSPFPALLEAAWVEHGQTRPGPSQPPSTLAPPRTTSALAPPISLQPARYTTNPRRNSVPRHTPAFLSHSHNASPHTPGQPSPLQESPYHRATDTPVVDPIIFSPHQNVREQDAIETLLFMSSPGNSANLKHAFPSSSSQPLPSMRNGASSITASPRRTALPSSQPHPRKSLPSGRPTAHQPQASKRVGFEKSPSNLSEMDVDEAIGMSHTVGGSFSRGTPRSKANGAHHVPEVSAARPKVPLSTPAGLGGSLKPRPALGEDDIERMLDRAAAEDSSDDSDSEIQIPVRPPGASHVGA